MNDYGSSAGLWQFTGAELNVTIQLATAEMQTLLDTLESAVLQANSLTIAVSAPVNRDRGPQPLRVVMRDE